MVNRPAREKFADGANRPRPDRRFLSNIGPML
jgi:hypothetical protein